jgi:short-subunit dehydrogenase
LKDSWVVVTGGSDGIGLEICEQMAEKGFNICIIARNESKINEKLSILEKKHNVKTRCIVFDFAELCFISDYKKRIALKLKDIDIAMLFLNAGFAQGGAFAEQTDQDI